jgi:hypothetical protein
MRKPEGSRSLREQVRVPVFAKHTELVVTEKWIDGVLPYYFPEIF